MHFRLVSSRYQEFIRGLHLDQLPRTFGDAVAMTRCLGIDYLWIDSMCIIQDSTTDWERESLLMKDVYHGSFLNIAANAFFNPNGGLFQTRNPLSVTPVKIDLSLQPGNMIRRPFTVFPRAHGLGLLQSAPLSTRAWTVQERLLAPRTVHFLGHKVMWECSSLLASESDPTGTLETSTGAADVIRGWALSASGNGITDRPARCLWKWHEAIGLYTRGELTFQTDKLIAAAGIAGFIQAMWNDSSVRYLAGLWSYQLEWSLLWQLSAATAGKADSRAPTWSWASVRGHIFTYFFYHQNQFELLAHVLEAETYPVNDPLGPVNGGHIRLEGPMCAVTLGHGPNTATLQLPSDDQPLEFSELSLDDEVSLTSSAAGSNGLHLLGVIRHTDTYGTPIWGLVLQSMGMNNGEYIRVGFWSVDEDGSYESIEEAFHSMSLDPKDFEVMDRQSRRYTINII